MLATDGSYTYSVANSATQFLAATDTNGGTSTYVDTFTVTSADGTTKQVAFTIHGSNDAPITTVLGTQSTNQDTTKTFSGSVEGTPLEPMRMLY